MPLPALPLALAAAGALSAFAKNRQYRPVTEANDRTGALLDIAGAGLGGFLGGTALGGGDGLAGLFGGGQDLTAGLNLPARQSGAPGFIPVQDLVQGIAPGEQAGIPDQLAGLFGGGQDLNQLALLAQLFAQQQSTGGGGLQQLLGQ